MKAVVWAALGIGAAALAAVLTHGCGLTARRTPWPGEATAARLARSWTLPASYRRAVNPVPASPEVVRAALEHWADHCAGCHGNDGRGTAVGRGLFPPVPDMREKATQDQSDGALFYAIEFGVPFSGMPAWGNGASSGERASWELVRFIRHLPSLTPDDVETMEKLNPQSAADIARERGIEDFLNGPAKPATEKRP